MKRMPFFHKLVASGFGTGYSPVAPGTCGAVLALLIWWGYAIFIDQQDFLRLITMGLVFLFTILGVWSSNVAERYWGKDPSRVVVDEMVGTWITLLAVPDKTHWGYAISALILFRFFDIIKPLGIRKMEKLPAGYGIMGDDILAGIYGFIVLSIYKFWFT